MLTGCAESIPYAAESTGAVTDTAAQTESAETGEAAAETTLTSAETAVTGDAVITDEAAEIAAARTVLEQYLEGYRDRDTEKILSATNYRDLMSLLHEDITEEELREHINADGAPADFTWEITDGKLLPERVQEYNSALAEEFRVIDEEYEYASEEDRRSMDAMRQIIKPIEAACSFTVSVHGADQETDAEPEEIVLTRTDGKWVLDTLIAADLLTYVKRSQTSAANAAAHSLFNASMSAMTDMYHLNDYDFSLLNGDISITKADFENAVQVKNPATAEEMKQELAYRILQYYEDAAKLDGALLNIKDSYTQAVAVGWPYRKGTVYGTWPVIRDENNSEVRIFSSLEEALDAAKAVYNE